MNVLVAIYTAKETLVYEELLPSRKETVRNFLKGVDVSFPYTIDGLLTQDTNRVLYNISIAYKFGKINVSMQFLLILFCFLF